MVQSDVVSHRFLCRENLLPLLGRVIQRLTIYRCRFCGEHYRHWLHPPLNGVCPHCLRDFERICYGNDDRESPGFGSFRRRGDGRRC